MLHNPRSLDLVETSFANNKKSLEALKGQGNTQLIDSLITSSEAIQREVLKVLDECSADEISEFKKRFDEFAIQLQPVITHVINLAENTNNEGIHGEGVDIKPILALLDFIDKNRDEISKYNHELIETGLKIIAFVANALICATVGLLIGGPIGCVIGLIASIGIICGVDAIFGDYLSLRARNIIDKFNPSPSSPLRTETLHFIKGAKAACAFFSEKKTPISAPALEGNDNQPSFAPAP